MKGRFLHFVLKVGNRAENLKFLTDFVGMKILRHEEFSDGCAAQCNGPYSNRWSKTMVGFEPEDDSFVLEITYNYTKKSYKHGNDFYGFHVHMATDKSSADDVQYVCRLMPEHYRFVLERNNFSKSVIDKVILNVTDIKATIAFYNGLLEMPICDQCEYSVQFRFDTDRTSLEMCELKKGQKIDHAEGYGRLAFSCSASEQEQLAVKIAEAGYKILTPLVDLETPGKATVKVLIVADPDGHEICLVEDSGFRELSRFDPEANAFLQKMIAKYPD